jgi:hypothetical protein
MVSLILVYFMQTNTANTVYWTLYMYQTLMYPTTLNVYSLSLKILTNLAKVVLQAIATLAGADNYFYCLSYYEDTDTSFINS